ncbi:MAG TPA: adventurous gliding motility protein CglE [Oligoflexia bacterium]|nr:adventurous gliding motility protein CglE [Oligoflexia bacterium]HMR24179.1 adventurous gliding motility protein CglE [Oligoflexia bacterium]
MRRVTVISLIVMFIATSQLPAENLFGEFRRLPDEIEKGFYIGADVGISILNGAVDGTAPAETTTNPGTTLSFNMGYDITKNISIESLFGFAIHEASPQDPQLEGGVNFFSGNLLLKLQKPIGRWNPFVAAGGGVVFTGPEFVDGEKYKMSIAGAAGIEYYTLLRHYSLYFKINYFQFDLPVNMISPAFGIKYTF